MEFVFNGKGAGFLLGLLAFLFFFHPVAGEAHSTLKDTSPEGGASLEKSPSALEIWFQDPVTIHPSSIQVRGSGENLVSISNPQVSPENPGHIISNIEEILKPGEYKVSINVIAQDGFVIEEEFEFSIEDTGFINSVKELKLEKTNISDGETVSGSPNEIELWFNQPVQMDAFGIFDDQQQTIKTKSPEIDPDNSAHVTIPVEGELHAGSYQITWYASPAKEANQIMENNKVGVFYFAVDTFSPMRAEDTEVSASSFFYFPIGLKQMAYWFTFIGLTVLFGTSWFRIFVMKDQKKEKNRKSIIFSFYILSLTGISLLLIHQRSELSDLPITDFLMLKYTWVPIIQFFLITIGIWMKKLQPVFFGLALLFWPFIIGHASYPRYGGATTMVAASLHVLAVGIWMGGLAALLFKPKGQDAKTWLSDAGQPFSKWAFGSVVVIILSGLWMTVSFLPSFSIESLLKSEWGRTLIVKTILFLLLVILGYFQRKTIKRFGEKFSNVFFKRVRTESIYGLLIFFFAASLVAANPSAAEQGVYRESTGEYPDLYVDIDPLGPGLNTFTFKFENTSQIKEVEVELSMPPDWKVKKTAFEIEEGVYKLTGNLLHAAGSVNMKVNVALENGEEIQIPYQIVVPGEIRFNE